MYGQGWDRIGILHRGLKYTGVLANRFVYIRYGIATEYIVLVVYQREISGVKVYAWSSLERSTFSSRAVNCALFTATGWANLATLVFLH